MKILLAILAVLLLAGPVAAWDNTLEMTRRDQEAAIKRLESDIKWGRDDPAEMQQRIDKQRRKSETEWRILEQQRQFRSHDHDDD